MNVLVAGGSGFVGRALCRELAEHGHDVTAASRSPNPARLPDGVRTATLDVTEPDLTDAVAGQGAVVNLVALPSHVQPRGPGHEAVHREGTRHLVRACETAGVDRFVQMSALGVDSDVSTAYFRAKREGERIVRDSSLEWVIYRPSVVFGEGAPFLAFLERLTAARIVPLPAGDATRLQPIWVGDLAAALRAGVEDPAHAGATYEIGGPDTVTLAELVTLVRPGAVVVRVPKRLARLALALADAVAGVPLGRDQYRVLGLDNTVAADASAVLGMASDALTSIHEFLREEARRSGSTAGVAADESGGES